MGDEMPDSTQLLIGAGLDGQPIAQAMRLANRHGLIAGATGTGKTVTLQRLAEAFSDAGVAVFAADIKGDLCGLGAAATPQGKAVSIDGTLPISRLAFKIGEGSWSDTGTVADNVDLRFRLVVANP